MRSRGIVGKRVARIDQARVWTGREFVWNVNAIVMEDGTRLCPMTCETDFGEYQVEVLVFTSLKGG